MQKRKCCSIVITFQTKKKYDRSSDDVVTSTASGDHRRPTAFILWPFPLSKKSPLDPPSPWSWLGAYFAVGFHECALPGGDAGKDMCAVLERMCDFDEIQFGLHVGNQLLDIERAAGYGVDPCDPRGLRGPRQRVVVIAVADVASHEQLVFADGAVRRMENVAQPFAFDGKVGGVEEVKLAHLAPDGDADGFARFAHREGDDVCADLERNAEEGVELPDGNIRAVEETFSFKLGYLGSFGDGYGTLLDHKGGINVAGKFWVNSTGATAEGFGFMGAGGRAGSSIQVGYLALDYALTKAWKLGLDYSFISGDNNYPYIPSVLSQSDINDAQNGKGITFQEIAPSVTYKVGRLTATAYYGQNVGEVNYGRGRVEMRYDF